MKIWKLRQKIVKLTCCEWNLNVQSQSNCSRKECDVWWVCKCVTSRYHANMIPFKIFKQPSSSSTLVPHTGDDGDNPVYIRCNGTWKHRMYVLLWENFTRRTKWYLIKWIECSRTVPVVHRSGHRHKTPVLIWHCYNPQLFQLHHPWRGLQQQI